MHVVQHAEKQGAACFAAEACTVTLVYLLQDCLLHLQLAPQRDRTHFRCWRGRQMH
jgi:hypothetical protein